MPDTVREAILEFVRDPARCRASVNVVFDPEGLEVFAREAPLPPCPHAVEGGGVPVPEGAWRPGLEPCTTSDAVGLHALRQATRGEVSRTRRGRDSTSADY